MITDALSVDKFNALNFDEKAWHVWHHANFLMIRQNSYYRVNLYYLNGYYIQLWYHVKRNRIAKLQLPDLNASSMPTYQAYQLKT